MSDVVGQEIPRTGAADQSPLHVIIVGFGLSGRAALNEIIEQNISYAVIESNPETVSRCTLGGVNIIRGDARHPAILRQAGIERATDIMVTLPNDQATLEIVQEARRINPTAKITARCTFVSGGMEATRRGADETIIAEQVVAAEFGRVASHIVSSKSAQ